MELLKHDIVTEFPQLKDKIHLLKESNHQFAVLYTAYEAVNQEIARVETGAEVMSDHALEVLKKRRLRVKDDIVDMLHKAK